MEPIAVVGRRKSAGQLDLYTRRAEGETVAAKNGTWVFKNLGTRGRKYQVVFGERQFTLRNFGSSEWLFYAKENKQRVLAKVKNTGKGFHLKHVGEWSNTDTPGMENSAWKKAADEVVIQRGGRIWKKTFNVSRNGQPLATVNAPARSTSSPRSSSELSIDYVSPGLSRKQTPLQPLLQVLVLVLVCSDTLDRNL